MADTGRQTGRTGRPQGRRLAFACALVAGLFVAQTAVAELPLTTRARPMNMGLNPRAADGLPPELEDVGIEDRSGGAIPKDIPLVDHLGRATTTGALFDGRTPVLLTLAYYACPMLCTMVLNGVTDAEKALAFDPGAEYRHVTVSIDPKDTTELAAAKRANYLAELGRRADDAGYVFLTATEADVRRLADAVGFRFKWDDETKQYLHGAGAFVVTPDGRLSRTFWGLQFPERDLRLALVEASGGRIGGAMERVMLYCYHYDPNAKSYVLAATRVMQAGGALTLVALGSMLAVLWGRERRRGRLAVAHA